MLFPREPNKGQYIRTCGLFPEDETLEGKVTKDRTYAPTRKDEKPFPVTEVTALEVYPKCSFLQEPKPGENLSQNKSKQEDF